jgi:glycosyltransferase involved in cell wall biosynthesis
VELTVAMCTYNPSRDTIVRALDSIVGQIGDVPEVEVLVVDNNSGPPLADREYLSSYPIRLIVESTPGLTAAREAVIRNAAGNIILFVDDDNILDDRYLTTVVEAFVDDPELGLIGGCVVPEYELQPPPWFAEFESWLAVRRYDPELRVETNRLPTMGSSRTRYFPVGAGFAVRGELARAYQDDCAKTTKIEGRRASVLSSGEDLDLGLFALSHGQKLVVTGSLRLTHVVPGARIGQKYLQRLAVGNVKSSLALENKWAARLGSAIYPMFSMSLMSLFARTAITAALGLRSPRHRIKSYVYATLLRARLGQRSVPHAQTRSGEAPAA